MRLTDIIHHKLSSIIQESWHCLDATLGNGHDALFLLQQSTTLTGFDVQAAAIDASRARLTQADINPNNFRLIQDSHANILDHLDPASVDLATYNLGYLPGADKSIATSPNSTIPALDATLQVLKPKRYLSIAFYVAHPGGLDEFNAIRAWLSPNKHALTQIEHIDTAPTGPKWSLFQTH